MGLSVTRRLRDRKPRSITTDVVESPRATFETNPEARTRPVPGGVSGGVNGSTGTIGGWVWDTTDDSIVMLSNHHVFGHTADTDILQQGTADGGSLPGDKIGDVKRGIPRTTTGTNIVDCAIGDPDNSEIYDLQILEIGSGVYTHETATLDMEVEKFGQTTEHTFGRIIDADYSTIVDGNVFSALNLTNLCSGAFANFLDGMFGDEAESAPDEEALQRPLTRLPSATSLPSTVFTAKERRQASARNPFRGISRDVQEELRTTRRRAVTEVHQ